MELLADDKHSQQVNIVLMPVCTFPKTSSQLTCTVSGALDTLNTISI